MKIITWNVNSINQRLQHLTEYLRTNSPDVVLLQETKVVDENFPKMEIEDCGYNIVFKGQKTFNGVSILSKFPIEDVTDTLGGEDSDDAARYIEAFTGGFRVVSVYVPNGQSPDSDKFQYKMRFYDRLRAHVLKLLTYNEKLAIGGDYNVAPAPIDVYDPISLEGTTCFHSDERKKFQELVNLGLTDAFRACHPNTQQFSWWDYRGGSWQYNKGMRIDHFLLSPEAADCLTNCEIDTSPRSLEKPSDHTPVVCTFKS